ncbi:hypothetical protein [Acinetobacter guillouiae]|uniref:hypothetical protein n=1 Tax=Acinetobacter guillouiae TaxID=106649 RepID=UPI002FD9431C
MNTKPHSINTTLTHRVQPLSRFKIALVTGLLTVGAIALAYDQTATQYEPPVAIPNVTTTTYNIDALKLTSDTSGIAVIKLDSFLLNVSFDFDTRQDNDGVPGTEFTAVDITNLAIDEITDVNGKDWNDFTDYNDHTNINQMIVSYIERNKLVEAN